MAENTANEVIDGAYSYDIISGENDILGFGVVNSISWIVARRAISPEE